MIRRTTKWVLETIGALLAGLALLAGFLAYRLTQEGPIHLKFLSPQIERSVAEANRDFTIAVEDTLLAWGGWQRGLEVRALNLHVMDRSGAEIAMLPNVALTFSVKAALRGLIAPSEIEILSPDLALQRGLDGSLSFGLQHLNGDAGDKAAPSPKTPPLPELLRTLLTGQEGDDPLGYLTRIALLDGKVSLPDQQAGITWRADHVAFEVTRGAATGLEGRLNVELPQFGGPALATAVVDFDPGGGAIAIDAAFQGLDLLSLGLIEPRLTMLSSSDAVLSGHVSTSLDTKGELGAVTFRLNTASAQLVLPDTVRKPIPVALLQIDGNLDRVADRLTIEKVELDLGGPHFTVTGTIDGLIAGKSADGGNPLLALRIDAGKIPAERMDDFWPFGAADDTRAWLVPNIPQGMVDKLDIDLRMRLAGAKGDAPVLEKFNGTMAASDLTVHYLRPMPPIVDGIAKATFDTTKFAADIKAGHVGKVKIDGGKLLISGLDHEDQFISIGGDLASPLTDALALLDHPRLGYPTKLGVHPADAGGDAKTSIQFDFPAAKNLSMKDVKIDVTAHIEKFSLKRARFGQDVTDGTLDLKLDQDGMRITGPVVFAGMPLTIDWSEFFNDSAPLSQVFKASGPTTTAGRAALGFDFRPWLDGPGQTTVSYSRGKAAGQKLEASFDLTQAVLGLDFIKWAKPAGVPAKGSLTLVLNGDRPARLDGIKLAGEGFSAQGSAAFSPDGSTIARLALTDARFGDNAMTGVTVDFGPVIAVTIANGKLNAEPWLETADAPADPAKPAAEETGPERPYAVKGRLDQVRLGDGRALANVEFDLQHDPYWWDRIVFNASLPGGAPIGFDYRPGDPGEHRLRIEAGDAGAAFRVLDIFDFIKGGKLTVTGKAKDDAPDRQLQGKIRMDSFRLLNTPFAARFLSVAALTGLVDMLSGEGFLFGGASATFTKTKGRIEVHDFRSAGPSIGLTSKGTIDLDAGKIDLQGVLVPAYAINSLLDNIPVLGPLLQGGPGEGLFAATYKIGGALSEPNIDVNGWSALAPGFIRNLFTGDIGGKPRKDNPQFGRND